jgi:hypothetical protein
MTHAGCGKTKSGSYRKHTPIVSEKQRRLFRAAAAGRTEKAPSLSKKEAKEHLEEVKGKRLRRRK